MSYPQIIICTRLAAILDFEDGRYLKTYIFRYFVLRRLSILVSKHTMFWGKDCTEDRLVCIQ
jgi:hypothetical protein